MNIDFSTPAWREVAAFLESELEPRRIRLENPDLDPLQTAVVRGEVKVIRRLLGLPAAEARQKEISRHTSPDFSTGHTDL